VRGYVVDACVAAKWYLPEEHRAEALLLLKRGLYVPTLIDVELASVMGKKVRSGQLMPHQAAEFMHSFHRAPVIRHSVRSLVDLARDLAIQTRQSVYDSIYLALAVRRRLRLVTADRRFVEGLAPTIDVSRVIWVADMKPEM
jgi:predicted nucleic acid-binding protein